MISTTGFSGTFKGLKAGSMAIAIVAAILSCSESSTAPDNLGGVAPSGSVSSVVFYHPDSAKLATAAEYAIAATNASSAVVVPVSVQNSGFRAMSSVVAAPTYSVFPVAFAPEATPVNKLRAEDDAVTNNVPIGFLFKFFANNYNIVHISSNGFFGFVNSIGDGYKGGTIPNAQDAPYNNLIALAWTDLDPSAGGASYSYGTIGTAPNRKFVVQWTNVPEYDLGPNPILGKLPASPPGHVTAQVVLSEGSNDITMYTTRLDIASDFHPVTQGIESVGGAEAAFFPGRVQAHFVTPLVNDGIRFSFSHVNQPPVIVAPPNIAVNTDPGVCSAAVNAGAPSVSDDAPGSVVTGARSDGQPIDAAYPARVTSITWTATDAGGLKTSAAQAITVSDKQVPTIVAPASISRNTDVGKKTATVILETASASDNCDHLAVVGARSDGAPLSAVFPIGITTITWTANDGSGNIASADQTVTVIGNQPPVLSAPDIEANTDMHACSAGIVPSPTVTDDAPGTVLSGVRSDGARINDAYPKGLTTIQWTAIDAGGLTASANQKVMVHDREKPSIGAPASVSAGNSGRLATVVVVVSAPSADDNCKVVTVAGARSDGAELSAPFPVGTTMITWSATDPSLNVNTATQAVTVLDVSPPTIEVPSAMMLNATMPAGAVAVFSPSAEDNVGVSSLSCSPASGSVFPIGETSVTCTAADAAGNQSSASFVVTVLAASEQIANLITQLSAMNLPNGDANPLLAQLRTAYRSPGSNDPHVSCIKMNDFIAMMGGQDSDGIRADTRFQIIEDSRRIVAVLGC
ncbi:MAG: HYR domain-containing protein [Gemmatimonadaceae bacterium]